MKEKFEQLINIGMEQLDFIDNPKDKALVCAELAQAIISTGVFLEIGETSKDVNEPEVKEEKKTAKKKTSSKGKSALKKEAAKEEITEEIAPEAPNEIKEEVPEMPEVPTEPVSNEVEIADEWTEEMIELKGEQLGRLNQYVDAWGEEYVYGDALLAFSEGAFSGGENVRPTNIDGFLAYLDALATQE